MGLILVEFIIINPDLNTNASKDELFTEVKDNVILHPDINKVLANTPTAFTENIGQLENDEVRFYAQDGSVWFTDDGVWFELREYADTRGQGGIRGIDFDPMEMFREPETEEYRQVVLKQEFVGANIVKPMGREPLSWKSNFFYGNDSSKWCTDVSNYQEIFYKNIFDGIDLRYYTNEKGLKYDFIVHPNADVHDIRIRYVGADGLAIDDSRNLMIKTPLGDIVDSDLFIYQNIEIGKEVDVVDGRFKLLDSTTYGFELLDEYDRSEVLIIDPLIYSTYVGGMDHDQGKGMTIDSNGSVLVTGMTRSKDFPNTTGALYTSHIGNYDAYVFKLNPTGSSLIYSTYVGGSSWDRGHDIKIDTSGNVYVTGDTESADFPVTNNAFDTTKNETVHPDIFVFKLNYNGSSLIYSTFVGGNGKDIAYKITIDTNYNTYITGYTDSTDFPITTGAYDNTYNGNRDVFIFKLSSNGSSLIFSTYIGGDGFEQGCGISLDSENNVYVTGDTLSNNFPNTIGAFSNKHNGRDDVFLLKLSFNGSSLNYSTYIGGNDHDVGRDISVDSTGLVYLVGNTYSKDFPNTTGAYDTTKSETVYSDTFVLKLNLTTSKLLYSTFIGGNDTEWCWQITIDLKGCAYVAGYTYSSNFPNTLDAYDNTYNGGPGDVVVFKLDPTGSSLLYSTYIGGNDFDNCHDIEIDLGGNIYLMGETYSIDFPNTTGVYDNTQNGNRDVFVLKLYPQPFINITSLSLLKDEQQQTIVYSRVSVYTFRVNITDVVSLSDIGIIRLNLDPLGSNIQILWNRANGQFSEVFDPNDFITLDPSSRACNIIHGNWTIDFNVTFNWTYPNEAFHDVQAYATSARLSPAWFNATDLYRVENDLVFDGTLLVKGEDNRIIFNNSVVRGGERLNWTGLTPVYEGTTDLYPPADEIDITIWDETNNYWSDSPAKGEPFNKETITPNQSKFSFNYTINVTGIPQECDKTNTNFSIRIDGDNVSFSNHRPEDDDWQRTNNVFVGVTITDTGGGYVNSSSVMMCISSDNGVSWGAWEPVLELNDGTSIIVQKFATFEDGNDNLIKWCAKDSLGNGPTESEPYRVLVDTQDLLFSNAWPSDNEESSTENVTVGITISDLTSGIDSSRIKYTVSYDDGKTWDYWKSVAGFEDGYEVNVTLNLTFLNGTENRIKWQAYDIAGNGPVVSEEYIINVNRIIPPIIPTVHLLTPENNSIISTSSVELSWILNNSGLIGITYKVIVDDVYPPVEVNQSNVYITNFMLTGLKDGKTYYWTIIPTLNSNTGTCISGIWSFTVDIIHIKPSVELVSPPNGSIIQALRPTFVWEVNYDGSEELTYDIYVGKNKTLEKEILDCQDTNYLSKDTLVFNETYYWKVVPKAGDKPGIESETWWFTVRPKDYVPTFGVELILEPSIIEIKPGESRYVNATVTNLGEYADKIVLSIPELSISGVNVVINDPKIIEVDSKGNAVFNISIQAKENVKEEVISITVVAASSNAARYDQVVEKRATLTVKILGQEKHDTGKSTDASWYWIILLIIFVIVIVLIIVGLILKRKKEPEPESQPLETSTTELDPEVEVFQTPEIVSEVVTAALKTIPTVDTTRAESTPPIQATPTPTPIPGQTPQPQITEAPEQPQLPPVQNELDSQPEVTELPINQQLPNLIEEKVDETKKENTPKDPANDLI